MLKNLFKSQVTVDTQNTLHNCPSCKCKNNDHSISTEKDRNKFFHPSNNANLYLSKYIERGNRTCQDPCHRSIIVNPSTPSQIPFLSPTKIRFYYQSPPKRDNKSLAIRFNTKLQLNSAKKKKFPHLHRKNKPKESQENSSEVYYCYPKYVNQKTPQKPKLLRKKIAQKLNNSGSRQKIQLTLSKKSSKKSLSQYESEEKLISLLERKEQSYHLERKEQPLPEVNVIRPMHNPQIQSQGKLMPQHIATTVRYSDSKHFAPKTIYTKQEQFLCYSPQKESKSTPYSSSNNNLLQQISDCSIKKNLTTNQIQRQKEKNSYEFARSISDELDLNYDYYQIGEETDRSISNVVSL